MDLRFSEVVIPTSADNMPNWRNDYPCTSIKRYWIFALATSVPDASRVMLRFLMNNKNSPDLPLSNKDIFNSKLSDFCEVRFLRDSVLTQSLSNFSSLLLLIIGIRRWRKVHFYCPFITGFILWTVIHCRCFYFALAILGDFFAECHTPQVGSSYSM